MAFLAAWVATVSCLLEKVHSLESKAFSRRDFLAAPAPNAPSDLDEVDAMSDFREEAASFHRLASATGSGLDFVGFAEGGEEANRSSKQVIWVTGFPRSGSSTLLSMVSVQPNASNGSSFSQAKSFSLFEPCHEGDKVDPDLKSQGCGGLLEQLSRCQFHHIHSLWGWQDPHSSGFQKSFKHGLVNSMCKKASRITFKTVDYGHDVSEMLQVLHHVPNLQIVASVRDPRGIFASWKTREPFATLVKEGAFYSLEDICRSYAKSMDVDHPRLKRVNFESLVTKPQEVTSHVYRWLGLDFGVSQRQWVESNFNNKACPPPPSWQVGFDDCREDSAKVAEHWREVLSEDDLRRFSEDENCQRVKRHYEYGD